MAHLNPHSPSLAPTGAPALVVVGCGNLHRSDDAAGVLVIQQLRLAFGSDLPQGVKLFDAGTAGMEVMFQARGATGLIVVDACRSGSEAGAIFRVPGSEIDTVHVPAYSLHDFRWDHAIHAGRRIFGEAFPTDVTVYLIEAGSLQFGSDLTAPVSRAVATVCQHVTQHILDWQRDTASEGHP